MRGFEEIRKIPALFYFFSPHSATCLRKLNSYTNIKLIPHDRENPFPSRKNIFLNLKASAAAEHLIVGAGFKPAQEVALRHPPFVGNDLISCHKKNQRPAEKAPKCCLAGKPCF
jgi:hypothetical protein